MGEPRKEGKSVHRGLIRLATAMDKRGTIYLGCSEKPSRIHLRIICPMDGRGKHFQWSESENHLVMSKSVTPWTVAWQAPLSKGFSRQEYWSGLPFPSPGDLPNPGVDPGSPALQTDFLSSEPPGTPSVKYWASNVPVGVNSLHFSLYTCVGHVLLLGPGIEGDSWVCSRAEVQPVPCVCPKGEP